jgi:uncharacterized protein
MRPGVEVSVLDSPPPRSESTDVGVWFVPGLALKGGSAPQLVRSMSDFVNKFGDRQSWSGLYDTLDVYFREGGTKAYVARVVGPAAANASVAWDANNTFRAAGAGAYYNNFTVKVNAGTGSGTFNYQVLDTTAGNAVVEQSPDFASAGDMSAWAAKNSGYVTLSAVDPTLALTPGAAKPLAGGNDDHANANDATYTAALNMFASALGPGQVSVPGRASMNSAVLAHAEARNRVAILDAPDSASAAALTSAATALKTDTNARYGGMFGPVAICPGIVSNTVRNVPYSAVQAGLISRLSNPNQPAAGVNGMARYATAVKYDYTDAERESMNAAGVNIARNMFGGVRTYGYRTLVDPNRMPEWLQLNSLRTVMAVKAQAEIIGENYVFSQIDGRRINIGAFNGELTGMLIPFYREGALYGETPADAFYVDTGPLVNTPDTIADGQLRAVIGIRTSPFAEMVEIEIVKLPLPDTT